MKQQQSKTGLVAIIIVFVRGFLFLTTVIMSSMAGTQVESLSSTKHGTATTMTTGPTVALRFFNSGTCPFAQRAWIALEECEATYETVKEDLQNKSKEFEDLYAKANPIPGARAKVPLLVVDAATAGTDTDDAEQKPTPSSYLTESLIVSEYIAELYNKNSNNALLPSDPVDRATMRLFFELCGGSTFNYVSIVRAKTTNKQEDFDVAVASLKENFTKANTFLEHYSSSNTNSNNNNNKNGPFLFGTKFSLAECNMAPFVQRCCAILPAYTDAVVDPIQICDELQLQRLKQWILAVLDHPSVVATGVPTPQLIEGQKRMLARFMSMQQQK